ncbi:MAG TPA: hypothetical protein VF719_13505, partial [Abditibacteriaceae bacterium]
MLENYLLPWCMLAVSFFNTIILIWLGVTVLLRAKNGSLGARLAGLGFLVGGAFFAAHTAMLDYNIETLLTGIEKWWGGAWVGLVTLPGGWYFLMLWYSGFWQKGLSPLRRRQTSLFVVALTLGVALLCFALTSNPFHLAAELASFEVGAIAQNVPLLFLFVGFPIYMVLCIGLALDALQRPDPSGEIMADFARRRARPWLIASTLVQLAIIALIVMTVGWLATTALRNESLGTFNQITAIVDGLELLVTLLISFAITPIGKAVVSYEIFSGELLPRGGVERQWRTTVVLAAVFSAIVSVCFAFELRPVYPLLVGTTLMSVFLALLHARSVTEREHHMAALRPFVASGQWYGALLGKPQEDTGTGDVARAFATLCRDVLRTRRASLLSIGSISSFTGKALHYVDEEYISLPHLKTPQDINVRADVICVPLEGDESEDAAQWAVPLWRAGDGGDENIGMLLLDSRRDNEIYTYEEMELARAASERFLDVLAGARLSRQLMELQRQRLAETQILDRRARRSLHDDILPRLHAAMLSLASVPATATTADALTQLSQAHRDISDLLREMPVSAAPDVARLGLLAALRRLVENEFPEAFNSVEWRVPPGADERLQMLSPLSGEVLFYAAREVLRNAERYARGGDA